MQMSKVYDIITQKIITQIEQIEVTNWKKPWFSLGMEPISLQGKSYRGINRLLLSGQESTVFGTYKGWKDKDCQVKKGEKSSIAVLWKFFQDDESKKTTGVMVRYFNVFNAKQVEGDYAGEMLEKQAEKLNSHDSIEAAEKTLSGYLDRENLQTKQADHASYSSSGMTRDEHINMPLIGQFKTAQDYYSTYLHECVHSTGHRLRLDRDLSGRFGSQKYAAEELIAELGAAMLCGTIGIDNMPREDHAHYLKSWLSVLKSDSKAIFTAASQAQKAADYILDVKPAAAA
jgi:antirestriction protein ArdC